MDRRMHFKAKNSVGHIKQVIHKEQMHQFFSEESPTESPLSVKHEQLRRSNDYQTDDSDCGTPNIRNGKGPQVQKVSKFKQSFAQSFKGDDDKPDPKENIKSNHEEAKDNTNTLEDQSKRMQSKYGMFQNRHLKMISSVQNLHYNSDSESKKKSKQQGPVHPFRHLIFGPQVNETVFQKHLNLTQKGLIYATKCLKGPSDAYVKTKQVDLPSNGRKIDKILVLDLDETLIHSCQGHEKPQVYVTARADSGEEAKIGVNIRPYLNFFLSTLSNYFQIYVFTASSPPYATAIIDYIDPESQYILGVLTRGNCMETKNGFFIKDLRILKKPLKDMLIVDNLAHSFGFQVENGVPILEWHCDPNDQELKYLVDYLIEASKCNDLREYNKQKLKLHELINLTLE